MVQLKRLTQPFLIALFLFGTTLKAQEKYFLIEDFDTTVVDEADLLLLQEQLNIYHKTSDTLVKLESLAELLSRYWDERHWYPYNLFYLNLAQKSLKSNDQATAVGSMEYYADALNNHAYALSILGFPDSALSTYRKALIAYQKSGLPHSIPTAYNNIAFEHDRSGLHDSALIYYNLALQEYKKLKDTSGYANTLGNKAGLLNEVGQKLKALKLYDSAKVFQEILHEADPLSTTYSNLANLYADFGDSSREIQFLEKSKFIRDTLGDDLGLINSYFNLGSHFQHYGNLKQAKRFYQMASKLIFDIGALENAPALYTSLGQLYLDEKQIDSSILAANEAIKFAIELDQPNEEAEAYLLLAKAADLNNNLTKALEWGRKALTIGEEYEIKSAQEEAHQILAIQFEKRKDFKNSYYHQKRWLEFLKQDSLLASQRSLLSMDFQRQLQMQKLSDSLAQVVIQEKAENEIMSKDLELNQVRFQRFALVGGIGFTFLISLLLLRAYKRKQKANQLISEQKKQVQEQRDLAQQNFETAELAKAEVEMRNTEILDSIKYAKRLQEAVLPPQKLVKEWLTNSFILYKPKDIVSGDFYWMETAQYQVGEKKHSMVLFAAADCTGHGVPGAMVSVICAGALNRAVNEFKLNDVGEILDKVSELVVESFQKSGEHIQDGMDIALCGLDIGRKTLYASGANNPIWILSKNDSLDTLISYKSYHDKELSEFYLHEFKGMKKPVGLNEVEGCFKTNVIQLQPGDGIYVFSDGYADQFGGKNGKKFKYQNFRNLILENFHLDMMVQKQKMEDTFEEWKGELEQIDDICVIGVKINGKERQNFTKRELEVLEYLEEGLPSKLIADKMSISPHTVDTYRRRMLAKTNTYNTTELLNYCKQKEII